MLVSVLGCQAPSPDRAPLLDTEEPPIPPLAHTPGRRVALLVEPTPFTHVSGYTNRFKEMLHHLKLAGDTVEVITPDDSADRPASFEGIPITYVPGFRLPFYKEVQLTLDLRGRARQALRRFRPDLIHAVAPGVFVILAIAYARLLRVPLLISYHTHLPAYVTRYVRLPGLRQLALAFVNWIIPATLNRADLALATSPQLQAQLLALGCRHVQVRPVGPCTVLWCE